MKNIGKILAIGMMAICTVSSCDMPQLMTESYEDVRAECIEYREYKHVKFGYEYRGRQYTEFIDARAVPLCPFTKGEYYRVPLKVSKYDTHTKVEVSKPHLVHRFNCRNN